jgi:hypothetical protein
MSTIVLVINLPSSQTCRMLTYTELELIRKTFVSSVFYTNVHAYRTKP